MLLKKEILQQIKAGDITLVFRKWQRPTVKAGGTLRTAVGVLAIDDLERVSQKEVTEADAEQAGYESKGQLLKALNKRNGGTIYRISLHYKGCDPRKVLREKDDLSQEELSGIRQKLDGIDSRSHSEPWTYSVLRGIKEHPGMKAGDLSEKLNVNKDWLKRNVRKLKELGLTISLSPGYKLSPRGKIVLKYLQKRDT